MRGRQATKRSTYDYAKGVEVDRQAGVCVAPPQMRSENRFVLKKFHWPAVQPRRAPVLWKDTVPATTTKLDATMNDDLRGK